MDKYESFRQPILNIIRGFDFIFLQDVRGDDADTKSVVEKLLLDLNLRVKQPWNQYEMQMTDVYPGPKSSASSSYNQRYAFLFRPAKIQIMKTGDNYEDRFTKSWYSYYPWPLLIRFKMANYKMALFNFMTRFDEKGSYAYPYVEPIRYSYTSFELKNFFEEWWNNFGSSVGFTRDESFVFRHRSLLWGDWKFDCEYVSQVLRRYLEELYITRYKLRDLIRNNTSVRQKFCAYDRIFASKRIQQENIVESNVWNFTGGHHIFLPIADTPLQPWKLSEHYPVYVIFLFNIISPWEIIGYGSLALVILICCCCCCLILLGGGTAAICYGGGFQDDSGRSVFSMLSNYRKIYKLLKSGKTLDEIEAEEEKGDEEEEGDDDEEKPAKGLKKLFNLFKRKKKDDDDDEEEEGEDDDDEEEGEEDEKKRKKGGFFSRFKKKKKDDEVEEIVVEE